MIAKVIVDVNSKQLDRPFDYRVPNKFRDTLSPGMRVMVPFGKRIIMGFVISINNTTSIEGVKDIIDIFDLYPALSEELLNLGMFISEETGCNKVQAFQAMLPSAMKAKYKKGIKVINYDKLHIDLKKIFENRSIIEYSSDLSEYINLISKEVKNRNLDYIYDVKDSTSIKFNKYLLLNKDFNYDDVLNDLNRAKKQRDIIEYLASKSTMILESKLINDCKTSKGTVKSLINKGYITEIEEDYYRDLGLSDFKDKVVVFNNDQKLVYSKIQKGILENSSNTYLLRGVTGSGKTEIYLKAIEEVMSNGKEAIMLIPEISLTPQMIKRFKGRFKDDVAILHSRLSINEKYDEWRKIINGDAKIALGARSAIFAPFSNLGLIIIDEEHESTYKQDTTPKYSAIEIAKKRIDNYKATLILGSATPSVESYARAQHGVFNLVELNKRANDLPLPKSIIIDMKNEKMISDSKLISTPMYREILDRINNKEQVILLLNRRGYNNFILCKDCGNVIKCDNCDISLTYHKYKDKLVCHYCGLEKPVPTKCPTCASSDLSYMGIGTQKAEEDLMNLFPNARILRMDMDTTSKKGSHEKIIKAFEDGEADILLGTQMISKGLDFPNVTLVGILSIDATLNLPDYRSGERTFQLIAQVAGRAGRHEKEGQVLIQTYNPDHYSIKYASEHDYLSFYENEMNIRRLGKYSPYFYVEQIVISDKIQKNVFKEGSHVIRVLKKHLSDKAIILGPTIPYISKVNNYFRTQIIIKYKRENNLLLAYKKLIEYFESSSSSIAIDRYPSNLM